MSGTEPLATVDPLQKSCSRSAVCSGRWWHPWLPDPLQQLRVCVSSQVHTKLQMVYAEALRSLTHTPAHRILLIVQWNYTRGVFSAFLTTKLLWRKPRSIWSALGKLIKQQVNVNKAKETPSSCHCCGRRKKKKKKWRNHSGVYEGEVEKEWIEVKEHNQCQTEEDFTPTRWYLFIYIYISYISYMYEIIKSYSWYALK